MTKEQAWELKKRACQLMVDMGYIHVHTWEESHGESTHDIYQKAGTEYQPSVKRVMHMLGRYGVPSVDIMDEHEPRGSYLLAMSIRVDQRLPEEQRLWRPEGKEQFSACCTESWQRYRHRYTKHLYSLVGVVGHGEWAFQVKENE